MSSALPARPAGTEPLLANSAPEALRHCTQWQRASSVTGPSASYRMPPHRQLPRSISDLLPRLYRISARVAAGSRMPSSARSRHQVTPIPTLNMIWATRSCSSSAIRLRSFWIIPCIATASSRAWSDWRAAIIARCSS